MTAVTSTLTILNCPKASHMRVQTPILFWLRRWYVAGQMRKMRTSKTPQTTKAQKAKATIANQKNKSDLSSRADTRVSAAFLKAPGLAQATGASLFLLLSLCP